MLCIFTWYSNFVFVVFNIVMFFSLFQCKTELSHKKIP